MTTTTKEEQQAPSTSARIPVGNWSNPLRRAHRFTAPLGRIHKAEAAECCRR